MWVYDSAKGHMLYGDRLFFTGYAGYDDGDGVKEPGEGKNDPSMEGVRNVGPLPRGDYLIGPPEEGHGGFTLRLTPKPGTDTKGRGGFLIHGDSVKAPGTASLGCIILPRVARWAVWGSGDRDLRVV